jgi:methyl-accepting chemotaxis protein
MVRINDLRIGTKLIGGFVAVSLAIGAACLMAWRDVTSTLSSQQAMYTQQVLPLQQVEVADRQLYRMRGDLWKYVAAPAERAALAADIATDMVTASRAIAAYRPAAVTAEEKAALATLDRAWPAYQAAINQVLAAISGGHKEEAQRLLAKGGPMNAPRVACTGALESVVVSATRSAQLIQEATAARAASSEWWLTLWGFLGIGAALAAGVLLTRSITRPLRRGVAMVQELAKGHLGTRLGLRRRDELGVLADAMDGLAGDLQRIVVGTMKQIAAGDLSAEVTVNDAQDEIAPALKATTDALRGLVAEAGILTKAAVEGRLATRGNAEKFHGSYHDIVQGVNDTLDAVIGPLNVAAEYVDRISKGDIPPKITDTYSGDFNEIKNNLNTCIDALRGLEVDLRGTIQGQKVGDVEARCAATNLQGLYLDLARGTNEALDMVITPVLEAIGLMGSYAQGDLSQEMRTLPGKQVVLTTGMNAIRSNVMALVADVKLLSQAAVEGRLATRADATKHQGDFRKIVEGVNRTLDAVIGPLTVAAEYVDRISKGDIPPAITDTYNGDFNEIKNNLNTCIDAVNALVADAGVLVKAAVEGRLATRADATKHGGDFRKIIEGVNQTLDAVIGPLNVAAEYVDRISKGDIPPKITDTYQGDFNEIKNNLNTCIDALRGLEVDLHGTIQGQKVGDVEARCAATNLQGLYLDLARGTNEALDTVITPVLEAIGLMDRYAQGDLSQEMRALPGKQIVLTTGMNGIRNNVMALVTDVKLLSQAAVEGRLATRTDATKHQGDYRKIIEGVNRTLDAVIKPVNEAATVLTKVAQQDLRVQVQGEYAGDHAAIKTSINTMITDLRGSIGAIGQNAQSLGTSAEELSTISQQMAGNAEETATQTHVVSAASEQVSQNLTVVATSSEEMLASIREIAKSANEAARMAKHAVGVADATNQTVQKLGDSSQEIGNVIKVITSIAEQTNLLALNATIEAARAGDAGKGFAVVANEVKELAKETAKATEEISQKIEAIQHDTGGAVQAIGQISQLITQIDGVSNTIATAVEEQTATTNEIGRNITEAARGSAEIARNVGTVATAAQQASQGAADTQKAARALTEMAAQLQSLVGRFSL